MRRSSLGYRQFAVDNSKNWWKYTIIHTKEHPTLLSFGILPCFYNLEPLIDFLLDVQVNFTTYTM